MLLRLLALLILGGSHVPALSSSFGREVVDWLLAYPKQTSSLLPAASSILLGPSLVAPGLWAGWRPR